MNLLKLYHWVNRGTMIRNNFEKTKKILYCNFKMTKIKGIGVHREDDQKKLKFKKQILKTKDWKNIQKSNKKFKVFSAGTQESWIKCSLKKLK